MNNYKVLAKRYSMITTVLLILWIVLALLVNQTTLFLGLALGTIFSLSNLISTYYQVKRIGVSLEGNRVKFSFGTVTRIITSVIAVYIAIGFPELFDLMGVIIGLMITYVIILIEPIFHIKSSS